MFKNQRASSQHPAAIRLDEGAPGSYEDFFEHVVPVLQKRGLMQKDYRPGVLREKLFPGRGPYIADTHPAAGYRIES